MLEVKPDYEVVRHAVSDLLYGLGVGTQGDVNTHLASTDRRVAKMLIELTSGYGAPDFEFTTFPRGENDQMVVVASIPFASLCAHHLIPFFGVCHVGYVPNEAIVGLSKIPRVVRHFSRRLQVQEDLTQQIATYLHDHLKPLGVGVIMEAQHLCVAMRGVKERGCSTKTSSLQGVFRHKPEVRAEFQWLIDQESRHAGRF